MPTSRPANRWLFVPLVLATTALVVSALGSSLYPVGSTSGPAQVSEPVAPTIADPAVVWREPTVVPPHDLGLAPTERSMPFVLGGSAVLVAIVALGVVRPVSKHLALVARRPDGSSIKLRGSKGSLVLRSLSLAVVFWLAFSLFITFDVLAAVSLRLQLSLAYAAFWLMIGLILLRGTAARTKVLILGLFAVALSSVHWIDWNSRKPFLRDLNKVAVGMHAAEVNEIMGRYRTWVNPATTLSEDGEVETGSVLYRHTQEWWGNVDAGNVVYESGRVVRTSFSPD